MPVLEANELLEIPSAIPPDARHDAKDHDGVSEQQKVAHWRYRFVPVNHGVPDDHHYSSLRKPLAPRRYVSADVSLLTLDEGHVVFPPPSLQKQEIGHEGDREGGVTDVRRDRHHESAEYRCQDDHDKRPGRVAFVRSKSAYNVSCKDVEGHDVLSLLLKYYDMAHIVNS